MSTVDEQVETKAVSPAAVLRPREAVPREPLASATVGQSIGRFVVLEEVGRGGMGRVLRAYDPKLQREVALKEVRRDILDDDTTARLVREARAMAQLSHPNVVAVYDVEEDNSASLVIVMEYVAGETLKAWASAATPDRRSSAEIVKCFVAAGRGLAAAHRAGLLHRDFKPDNVLIGTEVGLHAVKVTDFGLAKGVAGSSSPSEEPSTGTRISQEITVGGTVMGTPRYMAPEQHRGETLTAAADQYAFCVALWEALHGAAPFAGPDLDWQKQKGPPPWSQRGVSRHVVDAVRRGLRVKASERWPDMHGLLAALQHDPARRRSRWALGLAGVGATAVGIAGWQSWANTQTQRCSGAQAQLVGVWDQTRRALAEQGVLGTGVPYASTAWKTTASGLDRYAQSWVDMYTEACVATTVRGEQSTEVMDLRMTCLQRAKLDVSAAADVLAGADVDVVNNAHHLIDGLADLEQCGDIEALQADVRPPRAEDAVAVAATRTHLAQASAERRAGRFDRAWERIEEADETLGDVEYPPVAVELAWASGIVQQDLGKYEESEAVLTHGLQEALETGQHELAQAVASELVFVVGFRQQEAADALARYRLLAQAIPQKAASMARTRSAIGSVLRVAGQYEDAEAEHRAALAIREKVFGPDHLTTANSHNDLGADLSEQGKHAEAEVEYRRALVVREQVLGPEHPDTADSFNNLGVNFAYQGRHAESEVEFRRALVARERALGPQHPAVADSMGDVALALESQGEYQEAEVMHRQTLAMRLKLLGPDHPAIAMSHNNLGNVFHSQGKHEDAEAEHRLALATTQKALGVDHPRVAMSYANLGLALEGQGEYAAAEAEYRRALSLSLKVFDADHPMIALLHNNVGSILHAQKKYEEASTEFRLSLAGRQKTLGETHPDTARTSRNLALALFLQGRADEAIEFAESAWANLRDHDGDASQNSAPAAFTLAQVLWKTGDDMTRRRRARSLAERAVELYVGMGESYSSNASLRKKTAEIDAWLAEHPV